MRDVASVVDWLIAGVPGCPTPQAAVVRLFEDLRRAGLPVDRYEGFVRTLHPNSVGRSFVWTPEGLTAREHTHAYLQSAFLSTPASEVVRTGTPMRARASRPRGCSRPSGLRATPTTTRARWAS
jgi:adenylate cyclase